MAKVKFLGVIEGQIRGGPHSDPIDKLEVGRKYETEEILEYEDIVKIKLWNIDGYFNSESFQRVY